MSGMSVPAVGADAVPRQGYLLDVREEDEWRACHVPDAVHIPLSRLGERAAEIPRERHVYVICRSGGRSAQATNALNDAGWRATNVTGGMKAWAEAGREMVSEVDDEPRVV